MLSKKQKENVCLWLPRHERHKVSDVDVCRYCEYEPNLAVFNCVKLSKIKKKKVDLKIASGGPPIGYSSGLIPHSGDNCKGYPFLPNIKQGYDV